MHGLLVGLPVQQNTSYVISAFFEGQIDMLLITIREQSQALGFISRVTLNCFEAINRLFDVKSPDTP
jgi:hypothetical protein